MAEEKLITLKGTIECVIFHNTENGYTVMEMDSGDELVTVVGNMGEVNEGDQIKVMGNYISHHTFGMQFNAVSWEVSIPEGAAAIERYLASGAVKGIGPILAKKIVGVFGDKTLTIIEEKPELLTEVKGISPAKASKIAEEFMRVFGMRQVMVFLAGFNIPVSAGVNAWKAYGSLAVDVVKANPFALCTDGIGVNFNAADEVRRQLGIADEALCRLNAGILYFLQTQQWEGHSCYPTRLLIPETAEMLDVPKEKVEQAANQLLERESLVSLSREGAEFFYLPDAFKAEEYIATRISLILRSVPNNETQWDKHIAGLEIENGIEYASLQKKAINLALSSPIMVLTGGPGTGKTTTLNAIIELFQRQGDKVSIVAPTGRAAKRISELTGHGAKTIHRLLGVEYGDDHVRQFIHNEKNLLTCDVVVVDELSMVDTLLFESLLRALRMSCKIILVGDSDQLPPVGMGNVLKDLVTSERIPSVKLTEIFRQAAESLIVTNAHAVIEGTMPDLKRRDGDFFFLPAASQNETASLVLALCSQRLPKAYKYSPMWDIQVLCPNKMGGVGTVALNGGLQAKLNPYKGDDMEIKRGSVIYRVGDKVMQTKNNYEIVWKREGVSGDEANGTGVFNGDIGLITFMDKSAGVLRIDFDGRVAEYLFEQLSEIDLAYAITVHKSQGSEFEAVILPLSNWGGRLYYRNLLYTAVTRAKRLMIIVGDHQAVRQMVENTMNTQKYTNLSWLIQREAGS